MRYNKRLIIWVEALDAFDFVALFIETFFSGASVRYDEKNISGFTARLIGILQRCGHCKNFYMAKLTLGKKDTAGYALYYRKEDVLDVCLNRFCERYIPTEAERFKSAVKLYMSFYLEHRVTFVTMVEGSNEFKQGDSGNVIYLARHPLNSAIKQYYKKKGYIIRESASFFGHVKYFLSPCNRFFRLVAARFLPKRVRTNIYEPKPSIWIEYNSNNVCGFPFYHDAIDRKKFDVVCYLDRDDDIPLEKEARTIEGMGLKWIDLRSGSLARLANIGIMQLWDMYRALFSGNLGLPPWFRVFRFEFKMWYLLYKPVFSRFKVKVLIEHQEGSWVREPQMRALEDAGGIMLGYHWSNFMYYKIAHWSNPQHVYFVWGKVMHDWLKKKGSIARHVLPAGLWLGPSEEDAGKIRMKDGLKFIMAIFDSSVSYDIHQSEDSLAIFYLKLFDMLEKNPGWGGIVKSKNWSRINDLEFLPHGREIVSRTTSLIEQKRLIFLDNKISPVAAAARADISVCYSLNTAGIISSIYGHRAIHWDLSGWLHYPICKDPEKKVVFQNLEEMALALVRASAGDTEVGDFSKWKEAFNYFGDFNGRARISDFIRSFMTDIVVSGDPVKSLDLTVGRYVKTNDIKDTFFKEGGFWQDA